MSRYDRREIMNLSFASFLGLAGKLPALADQARRAAAVDGSAPFRSHLNWDALIGYIDRAARAQYEPAWDQNQYVNEIERLAKMLNLGDIALVEKLRAAHTRAGRLPAIEDLERRVPFQISLITFEPGQVLPLHDHPRMTGVMTCATGVVDVRRFRLLAINSNGQSCTLSNEGLVRMTPRVVSSLTAGLHNIHGLKAQTISQIIDIFTPPYDTQRISDSRWFHLTSPITDGKQVAATFTRNRG